MDIYEEIVKLQRAGHKGAVATIVNVRGSIPSFKSAKDAVRDDGTIAGTIGGGCVEAEVWQAAREVMENREAAHADLRSEPGPRSTTPASFVGEHWTFLSSRSFHRRCSISLARVTWASNSPRAAGHAGFDIVVTDDRDAYANRERFLRRGK